MVAPFADERSESLCAPGLPQTQSARVEAAGIAASTLRGSVGLALLERAASASEVASRQGHLSTSMIAYFCKPALMSTSYEATNAILVAVSTFCLFWERCLKL